MLAPMPYYCIHCGHEEPQVYKTYAEGNLVKLLECGGCGKLIDNYVEYETIILAINLLLLNRKAYRHVLLNHPFQGYWKLGIVFLFCESYCYWCFTKGNDEEIGIIGYQELEINFYKVLLRTFISTLCYHIVTMISCLLPSSFGPFPIKSGRPKKFSYLTLWKGLCLSGFAQLFNLITLIWAYLHIDDLRTIFVTCLFSLANMQCYLVITDASILYTSCVAFTAFFVQEIVLQYYDYYQTFLFGDY